MYGRELAKKFLGFVISKGFLKTRCIRTLKWGRVCIGDNEILEDVQNPESRWTSVFKTDGDVLPSELRYGLKWTNSKKVCG